MRTFASAVVGSLVLVSVVRAAEPIKAEDVLAMPSGGFRLTGETVEESFGRLAGGSGQKIFVNWKALEAAGVSRTLPVTLTFSRLTLGQAMTRMVDNLNTPGCPATIGFAVEDGVVTVSSTEDLAKNVETRAYDVRAWLPVMSDANGNAPALGPSPITVDPKLRDAAAEKTVRRVMGIQPRTWKANGGSIGSVRELGGQLIVTHTPEVHRLIAADLKQSPSKRTETILESSVFTVQFDAMPFESVIKTLAGNAKLDIDVQWDALTKAGWQKESAVSLNLRNVRLSTVLTTAYEHLPEGPNGGKVTEAIQYRVLPSGRIIVTTQSDLLSRFIETKRYPVGDLLVFMPSPEYKEVPTRAELEDSITSLIRDTIAVGSWAEKPGDKGGTLVFDGDTLVVFNDVATQAKVAGLLEKLREMRPPPATQPH
ncbi:MAG: hypothetical protein QM754_01240 [Tepidisphaeraceae bacterium]